MFEVNRSVAIIRPQAPFLNWLHQLPGNLGAALQTESLTADCNVLLIPAADDRADAEAFVLAHYHLLFEAELADWCEDDELWPGDLTPALFNEWFTIEIHSVVTDLVEDELERESFNPLDLG